jgi:hypothetical protein
VLVLSGPPSQRPWSVLGPGLSVVALVLALASTPGLTAAAQGDSPAECAAQRKTRDNVAAYAASHPDNQEAKAAVARADQMLLDDCGVTAGEDPPSSPSAVPPAAPAPTPAAEPQGTPGPPADSADRTDACGLLTSAEIGAVIGGAANADTPTLPGASGCEYRAEGAGNQPYVDVTYAQADGNGLYASLLAGAGQGASGATNTISGVGEQAFTYGGANGPGVVVLKANKVVILEFSYADPGESALLALARQAAARVG